ncbi:MAG: RdgB/HAM1 family non-canonical purine NTP pyrophosphatase [Candidatus Aminicenantes bacterium]|nr:RdgB/HAM1 family non-canonical purine NTP pyrophosphatase [Candidatus Aminicenantes bacterium]
MIEAKLLLATTNQGKTKEIEVYLGKLPIQIFSLLELNSKEIFHEEGKDFLEIARGKSLFYSQKWEGFTLAEDSGLEIEYLNGAPGVLSARFSGPEATDQRNIKKVLDLMKGIPNKQRKARFVSCMVLSQKEKIIKEIKESVKGYITLEERGLFGFGYDPIFYYSPLRKTFADLLPEEKNKISHRGRALKKLKEFLLEYLNPVRS